MLIIREYSDYNDYLNHQKEKTLIRQKQLLREWESKIMMFIGHFDRNKTYIKGRALGVCARTGQEVEALNRMGCDAIGVDIVPHPPLVIKGDAHKLPFNDNEFDFVFSNSLDHSIYPEVFLSEIKRVLKPGGYGMLHLQLTKDVDIYAENIILNHKEVVNLLDAEIVEARDIEDICYNKEIIFKK